MVAKSLSIETKSGVHYLRGVLDENADLSGLELAAPPLRLDLGGLTRLNSIGVRNFLKFLQAWGEKPLSYEHCTSDFVDQMNMIPALLGSRRQAVVTEVAVPFQCESCDHETEAQMKVADCKRALNEGPLTRPCDQCGKTMVVHNDSYFAFTTR